MDTNLELFKYAHEESSECFMEIDLGLGMVTWVNKCLKNQCLRDEKSVLNTSIYGLVDEPFRAKLSSMLSSHDTKHLPSKTVWPILCLDEKIAWWKINVLTKNKDMIGCSAEMLLFTGKKDNSYKYMLAVADSTYYASKSLNELDELKISMDGLKTQIYDEIRETRSNINASIEASQQVEDAANQNQEAIESLKNQVIQQFDIHTKEIIKLMTSDVIHDSRMTIFEAHVKKTTTQALSEIIEQANQSGKGLSSKVTIPAGLIAATVGLIQWVITHFFH